MSAAVGVDIGGSGIRVATLNARGELQDMRACTMEDRSVHGVCAALVRLLGSVEVPVGVGMPGFHQNGLVVASPNFPAWHRVAFADMLEAQLGVSVVVDNDATMATVGARALLGDARDLVLLTLGTGVGGGVITEGRLLRGSRGSAGEFGHMWSGGDQPCGCGGAGCLETWCSTTGLVHRAAALNHDVCDGAAILALADAGEPWAMSLRDDASLALGRALVSLANVFAPDHIALAGGLAIRRHHDKALAWFDRRVISAHRCEIRWMGRADELAIRGAAASAAAGGVDAVCAG